MTPLTQAFFWFLMQPVTVYTVTVSAIVMASAVSVLIIFRKWGGYS